MPRLQEKQQPAIMQLPKRESLQSVLLLNSVHLSWIANFSALSSGTLSIVLLFTVLVLLISEQRLLIGTYLAFLGLPSFSSLFTFQSTVTTWLMLSVFDTQYTSEVSFFFSSFFVRGSRFLFSLTQISSAEEVMCYLPTSVVWGAD